VHDQTNLWGKQDQRDCAYYHPNNMSKHMQNIWYGWIYI